MTGRCLAATLPAKFACGFAVPKAKTAKNLILASRDLDSVKAASEVLLYPAEYTIRAEALIEARRLVGGVVLEQV